MSDARFYVGYIYKENTEKLCALTVPNSGQGAKTTDGAKPIVQGVPYRYTRCQ